MANILFSENFLVTKRLYSRVAPQRKDRLDIAPPTSLEELAYQSLLSEANQCYFNREYNLALERYLTLRYKILVQSHPEMPSLPNGGPWWPILTSAIQYDPIWELSRKYYEIAPPFDPVIPQIWDKRMISKGEFPQNPSLRKFRSIGLDTSLKRDLDFDNSFQKGRELMLSGKTEEALSVYNKAQKQASKLGKYTLSAQLAAEAGALTATYASGRNRTKYLEKAKDQFTESADLFNKTGNHNAQNLALANLYQVTAELGQEKDAALVYSTIIQKEIFLSPDKGLKLNIGAFQTFAKRKITTNRAPAQPVESPFTYYLPADSNQWITAANIIAETPAVAANSRQVGFFQGNDVKIISITPQNYKAQATNLYNLHKQAKTLDELDFFEIIETNFVTYIPHLFFFVLPIAIADTYQATGRYAEAEREYLEAAKYTFINHGIEAPYLWLKMAETCLRMGDELFRQEKPTQARTQYEKILTTQLTVPNSSLYQGSLSGMASTVREAIKEIQGEPHATINYKVSITCMKVWQQLQKIKNGLNFLGLSDDYFPIFRYKYLQAVAAYMADQAIQTERTFINFRNAAESQKFERLQLQSNLELQKSALRIEQKRMEDANLEVQYASQAKQYATLRRDHAQDTLDEWNTTGRELASVNAALAWASNAANDQDIRYTGVQYHGERHDYDGDVEDFYDVVGEVREWINWELQANRLARQLSESAAEITLANTRLQQANVRRQIQSMTVELAQKRLQGAQGLLDYARDKMFDEEMWFRLAAELQDLSRDYLDMAIYSAFLMERAYEVEFDRRLNRIRLDYGIGGVEGLLGGDYLKRDIDSFTIDYLQHAQKKNPVRLAISLREEYPAAFLQFQNTGSLAFRTDLEIFDRLFPGTYRRKIKKLELFAEGLIPLEGATGFLTHLGMSTEWKGAGNAWGKSTRLVTAERMVLSSYQFRRDISVFQPSEQMLGLFENLAPQGNWTLEIPRASNNLDYDAISDIKLVLYFDADFDEDLRTFLSGFYANTGGKSVVLSSRFHFPDQYFRLDIEKAVSFNLYQSRFAFNHTNLKIAGFGIRLLDRNGSPIAAQALTVRRESDLSEVNAITDATGVVLGNPATLAPFNAWKNASPVDTFTVIFPAETNTQNFGDVHLLLDYQFTYRANG